jgi:hypothetical protein
MIMQKPSAVHEIATTSPARPDGVGVLHAFPPTLVATLPVSSSAAQAAVPGMQDNPWTG